MITDRDDQTEIVELGFGVNFPKRSGRHKHKPYVVHGGRTQTQFCSLKH